MLYHFSEQADIRLFEPRPVAQPSPRSPGLDWLNGPLVWAIDEWHAPMYFFPRDCPRILIWPLPGTTAEDRDRWWGARAEETRMLAYIESGWLARMEKTTVYRYLLPEEPFERLDDAGMYVSRTDVSPLGIDPLTDLSAELRAADVELRAVDSLQPLRRVWDSTLHASGIRLRNAIGWE